MKESPYSPHAKKKKAVEEEEEYRRSCQGRGQAGGEYGADPRTTSGHHGNRRGYETRTEETEASSIDSPITGRARRWAPIRRSGEHGSRRRRRRGQAVREREWRRPAPGGVERSGHLVCGPPSTELTCGSGGAEVFGLVDGWSGGAAFVEEAHLCV